MCPPEFWGNKSQLKSFSKKSKIAGKSLNPHKVYQFDIFSLDATAKILLRDGAPVTITRKAVETLLALVESNGQVVLKEDLLKTIWPDRVVEEANLTQNIAMVRRALAVERGSAAYIETFPGRGYRLVGPVTLEETVHRHITEISVPAQTDPNGNGQAPAPLLAVPPPNLPEAQTLSTRPAGFILKWQLWVAALIVIGGLALGFVRWNRRASNPEPAFRIAALTHLAGMKTQPALSPHGKRVAFLWYQEDGTTPQLHVQSAANAKTLWISQTPGHYHSPA